MHPGLHWSLSQLLQPLPGALVPLVPFLGTVTLGGQHFCHFLITVLEVSHWAHHECTEPCKGKTEKTSEIKGEKPSLLKLTLFFFLFWPPWGMWSSPARDQIWATFVTYAAASATPDPLTHCAGKGWNLHPAAAELQISLYHSGKKSLLTLFNGSPKPECLWPHAVFRL